MNEKLSLKRKIKNEDIDYNRGNNDDSNNILKRTRNCNSQENIFNSLNEEVNNEMGRKKHKDIMLKIANKLLTKDVELIKYKYSDIGDGVFEKIKNSTELIQTLEHHGYLGVNNYDNFVKTLKIIDSGKLDSKRNIQRRIPFGCIFKFDLHEDVECTLVEFKFPKDDNWSSMSNIKESPPYYLTRKKNNEIFIKVENLICENEKVYFRFSFQDSESKVIYCKITGECRYELSYKSVMIATSAPFSKDEFSKNIRVPNSLDWRKTSNIYLEKVPCDESIESIADIYIDRNFPDLNDVIYVRSFFGGKDFATMIIDKIYNFFSENKKTGICAILPGYHLRYHASLLKCNVESFKNHKDENRIIVFNSELNLILMARIATSLDCVKLESDYCLIDISLFLTVNSLLIKSNKLVILGIVVLPLIKRVELKNDFFFIFPDSWISKKKSSYLEQILFLCKDDIEDENFECWWRSVSAYSNKRCSVQSNNTTLFKKLIGLTMIVMAKVDMVTESINIPTLEFDPQKQIESLILNYKQFVSIHDKELKKIISGGYGSGKSIVGKEIVKNCITKQYEHPLTLYYICCNHFSLFECEMKEFVDSIKKTSNVTVVSDNLYELWQQMCANKKIKEEYISISRLLEYLVNTNKNKVCFVLEELSPDYVKHEDAIQLKSLFSSVLKESLVVFIPESIEKYREIIRNNEKQIIQKNCFNEETLGMKVFTLNKSMRVTECNKLLIDSSQNSICGSKTVCNFPNSKVDNKLEINEKASTIDLDNNFVNNSFDGDVNQLSNKIEESTNDLTDKGFHDYDFDHVSKHVAVETNGEVSNCFMETSFGFKSNTIGHSIKGEKPRVVFFPFHDLKKKRSLKLLSVVLEWIWFTKVRKTVVICNDMEEIQSAAYAIDIIGKYKSVTYSPHLQKYNPTISDKNEILKKLTCDFNILITDSKGFSGAESECVVVLVRPDEIYLRHVFVDAMARSNSYLIVLVINYNGKDQNLDQNLDKNGTIRNVLNDWSEDIVEKIIVDVSNQENEPWSLKDNTLIINENCKVFIDRGSKIKYSAHRSKTEFRIFTENYKKYKSIASNMQANKVNGTEQKLIRKGLNRTRSVPARFCC
ncbi:uncharacterized protein LOC136091242 isoform X2 [Hydra vulgaris]|uniref:Uncharacterized protein LOC136091242 isoform X2 n=1 Tax=Hydra vulgaris TaxID=6087 RepID=A0ABM4DJ87_HYDVU